MKKLSDINFIDYGTPHQDYNKKVCEDVLRLKINLDLSKNSNLDNHYYKKMRIAVNKMLKDLGVMN